MKKDLQKGRSMIEMLGVLSIIGILTVGGFGLISKTVTENKINKVIDEISDLARHTRIVFREFMFDCQSKNTATKICDNNRDVTKYLHDANAYPEVLEYSESSNDGTFSDDEDIKMKVTTLNKEAANNNVVYYVLEISNLSEEFCIAIANGQWGTAATNGFSGISFKRTVTDLIGKKIELDDAVTKCGTSNGGTIYLAFR